MFGSATRAVILDVTSGVSRTLCDCRLTGGTWNPDGVILLGAARNTPEGIRRMNVGESSTIEVTHVDASKGDRDAFPVFLPDGRRFLCTRTTGNGQAAAYLATLDGGEPKRIADGSARGIVSIAGGVPPVFVEPAGVVARPFDLTVRDDRTGRHAGGQRRLRVRIAGGCARDDRPYQAAADDCDGSTEAPRSARPAGAGYIDSVALSADGRKLIVSGGNAEIGEGDLWARDLIFGANTRILFYPATSMVRRRTVTESSIHPCAEAPPSPGHGRAGTKPRSSRSKSVRIRTTGPDGRCDLQHAQDGLGGGQHL